MRRHAFWLFFVCAVACRVPAVDGAAYSGPRNACELGCASGVGCVDGACIAAQTAYPLVFEVTPPMTAAFARGVTFTVPIADQKGATDRDLKLDQPARFVAQLDTNVGVTLRLRKVAAVPGAASSVFEASSVSGFTPVLTIPPGDYEVFISPTQDSDLATIPPVQLRDDATGLPLVKTLTSGSQGLKISYAGLRTLDISLTDNSGAKLLSPNEARDVFVIDETTGTLASTVAHTCTSPGVLTADVTLKLAPELTGHRYTLRAAPAATRCGATGLPLATVDIDLQSLDVEGRGNHPILAMPPTLSPPTVVGQVVAFGTNAAINDATIILRSKTLDQDSKNAHAFIEVRGDVGGAGGRFFLDNVLPGTYRATVIPGSSLALGARPYAICVDCTIPSQDPTAPDGTRVAEFTIDAAHTKLDFQIARRVSVTIGAAGFDSALFGLGTFEADTSSSAFLATATGSKLLTRSVTGTLAITQEKATGKTWNLAAALDPGVYDFVVRTPDASGYPWIVLPHTEVAPAPKLDVGVVKATAPVIFAGRILDPTGAPIPRATVRAQAFIPDRTDPKKPAIGAVVVGETRAGEDGSYRIVVPSDFATQPPAAK